MGRKHLWWEETTWERRDACFSLSLTILPLFCIAFPKLIAWLAWLKNNLSPHKHAFWTQSAKQFLLGGGIIWSTEAAAWFGAQKLLKGQDLNDTTPTLHFLPPNFSPSAMLLFLKENGTWAILPIFALKSKPSTFSTESPWGLFGHYSMKKDLHLGGI